MAALRQRIANITELQELSDLCLYITGSYGRFEASVHSDLDIFFMHKGAQHEAAVLPVQKTLIDAALIRTCRELGFPEFTGGGQYLTIHYLDDIRAQLGGPALAAASVGLAMAGGAGRPTVLLLDVMLPGMSGLEVCQTLRASQVHLPILMLGLGFSLIPAALWPAVSFAVAENRLGTAYALMTFLQQLGFFAVSWALGWANDAFAASATHPSGYEPGMWLLTALSVLGLFLASLLWRHERAGQSKSAASTPA